MKIKFKKLSKNAITPTKGREGDACFDLYAAENVFITSDQTWLIKTNIAMAIPEGYFGKIYTRSGMALKGWACDWGAIDSNYRGDIGIIIRYLWNTYPDAIDFGDTAIKGINIKKGDRIAQLAIHKVEDVALEETDELSDTNRGDAGYGSSGK